MFVFSIITSMENLCNVCPRKCNVNRSKTVGFCKAGILPKISNVMLHHFEEPPISGTKGSGAIFFSSCTLKCVYCQNFNISTKCDGKEISVETLASLFKQLEEAGANNINLVTPTHYTEQIIEALKIYKPNIPIVWNTSGYESAETIKKLKEYVDIYLSDFKYFSSELSKNFSMAPNYFEECSKATLEMRKNQPIDVFENGLMKKGLIIRHLCLPNQTKDSERVLDWILDRCDDKVDARETAIGYVPYAKDINIEGLSDISVDTIEDLLTIDNENWKNEAEANESEISGECEDEDSLGTEESCEDLDREDA